MKNLVIRAITGAVYVLALVGCTVWGPQSAFIFFALVAAGCVYEFGTIMNKHYEAETNRPLSAIAAFILCSAVWQYQIGYGDYVKMFALYGFTLLYIIVSELYRQADNPIRNWALAFASQIYIALPFSLLPFISIRYDAVENLMQYEWIYTLAIFIFLWTNDTGAYLVGSLFGRYVPYKLFPRISPKKSWIGSLGGVMLTIIAAAVIEHYAAGLPLWQWIGLALTVCVFGTWGDLVESLIKRQVGIKDSGKILPGHGGFLDRFDSALLAIPGAVIYLALIV
ncbi:MAG: phosphatidate cytidylyltransferase [Alloprevotella sp.]